MNQPALPVVEMGLEPKKNAVEIAERPDGVLAVIERLAASGASVETLSQVIALQERVAATRAKAAFDDAFAAMQRRMPVIVERAKTNTGHYAPLEDIVEAIRPIITEFGFALSHRTEWPDKGTVKIVGILTHREGHEKTSEFLSAGDSSGSKNAIQGLGSAISYGRRYTTNDLLNIVTRGEDDDAKRTARIEPPDGYDDWLSALATKADEEGLPALQAMWKVANGDADLRKYAEHLTKTEPATWNNLKAKAAKVRGVAK